MCQEIIRYIRSQGSEDRLQSRGFRFTGNSDLAFAAAVSWSVFFFHSIEMGFASDVVLSVFGRNCLYRAVSRTGAASDAIVIYTRIPAGSRLPLLRYDDRGISAGYPFLGNEASRQAEGPEPACVCRVPLRPSAVRVEISFSARFGRFILYSESLV